MPVMKNNYDIYKDTRARSRKTSECSNASSNGTTALASALGTPNPGTGTGSGSASGSAAAAAQQQRRRKVSECKSESFATSPSHGQLGAHRMQMQRCHSSRGFTRNTSRSSHGSMSQMMMMSPTRSSPPSRTQTASALERQAAAQAAAQSAAAAQLATQSAHRAEQSNNDYTKFHLRLVDKLRKSFRKDNAKRS